MLHIILNRLGSFVEIRVCGLPDKGVKKNGFTGIKTNEDFLALGRLTMELVGMTTGKKFNNHPYFKTETSGHYYPNQIIRLEYIENY